MKDNEKNEVLQKEEAVEEVEVSEGAEQPSEQELLQQKYDEANDRYLRLMAEYDNYRKRTQREKDEIYGNATAASLEKILPIWDNFQRAAAYDPHSEDFAKGFELIKTSFADVLKGFGLEEFGEIGDAFDPNLHYAVSHTEDDNLGENVLSQVLQKGYKIGDRIIRYAMVQTAN